MNVCNKKSEDRLAKKRIIKLEKAIERRSEKDFVKVR